MSNPTFKVHEHVAVLTMICPQCTCRFKITDDFVQNKAAKAEIEYWKNKAEQTERYYHSLMHGVWQPLNKLS